MPRLRQVPRDEAHGHARALYKLMFGDRDPVAEPGTSTGTPGDWWTTAALVPDVFDHCVDGFNLYRSPDRRLSPLLRELGQTRAGYLVGSRFVYSQHLKACREAGMPEAKAASIADWAIADCWEPIERALLAYTDALVLQHGRVSEEIFDALRAGLDDPEILEFTYITLTYMLHAVMSRALRLEYDDMDEACVEVPAPPGRLLDPVADAQHQADAQRQRDG